MFERQISVDEVELVLSKHVLVEDYPNDPRGASRLVLGFYGTRPLHLHYAVNINNQACVITVYEPDPAEWEATWLRRK